MTINNNVRQILLAYEACSARERIAAYKSALANRGVFTYALSFTEFQYIDNLLKKAEEEMRPKPNTWYPVEAFKTAGIISPVIAIYKFWSAERDAFTYVVKAMHDFEYSRDCVLGEKLRIVLCMRINSELLISQHVPQPQIIAGEGSHSRDQDLQY